MSDLTAGDRLKLARELVASDAWAHLLRPKIEQMLKEHEDAAVSRSKSPAERAEHIEAVHVLRELLEYPEAVIEAARREFHEKRQ